MLSRNEMDQQLSLVLNEYLKESLADLPTENELAASIRISPEFDARMQPLLTKARKMEVRLQKEKSRTVINTNAKENPFSRTRITNRKRLIVVMLVLAVLTSAISISTARERLFDFFIRIYERYSELSFVEPGATVGTTPESGPEADDRHALLPDRIPPGYIETERLDLVGFVQIVYADKAGNEVIFNRQLASGLQMGIDTEGFQTESVSIHGTNGLFYANKGVQNVIWKEDPYVYSILGKIDKNVLIDMAKATK